MIHSCVCQKAIPYKVYHVSILQCVFIDTQLSEWHVSNSLLKTTSISMSIGQPQKHNYFAWLSVYLIIQRVLPARIMFPCHILFLKSILNFMKYLINFVISNRFDFLSRKCAQNNPWFFIKPLSSNKHESSKSFRHPQCVFFV